MLVPLEKIEGRKFCVVFVKVIDHENERVQLQCLRGRANVERGRLNVVTEEGASFTVPGTAMQTILPSDGTDILQDAEYYCLVRVDDNIQLSRHEHDDCECDHDDDCDCDECHCGHHHEHDE